MKNKLKTVLLTIVTLPDRVIHYAGGGSFEDIVKSSYRATNYKANTAR